MKTIKILWSLTFLFLSGRTIALGQDTTSAGTSSFLPDSLQGTVITAKEIDRLPQRGLDAVLEIQPAIIVQDGDMHILGGRDDETGFYLNGLPIIDPFSNTSFLHIIPEAIEQIDIFTTGYSTRFGGANSGLVNTRLKTGGKRHHFSVDYQTDKFAAAGKKFLNTYSYRDQIISATAGGPLYFPNLRFFIALENEEIGDTQKRFSKGFRIDNLNSSATLNPDSIDRLTYPDGFTSNNSSKRWAGNATLLYKGKHTRSQLNFLFDRQKLYEDNQPMLHILNDRHQYLVNQNWFISGQFEHQLTKYLHYRFDAGISRKHSERYDDYFGNDWRKWSDSLAVARHTDGRVQYRNGWRSEYDYYVNGFRFERNGTLNNPWYFKQNQQAFFGRFETQATLGRHQIQLGMDARSYTMRNYEINTIGMMQYSYRYGLDELIPDYLLRENIGSQNFGYDAFGYPIEWGFNGPKKPFFASVYLEDRIIHKNAIFTFGLRYDYFDTDDNVLLNPGYPSVNHGEGELTGDAWKNKKPTRALQPRFGVTLFNNSGSQLYFTYGKYVQPPKSSLYYFNSNEYAKQIVSWGQLYLNPIGFNLDVVRSTSVIIGFKKEFLNSFSLNVNVFHKLSQGLPQTETNQPSGPGDDYSLYYRRLVNSDFSEIKGLNLSLLTKRKKRLQARFDYTYQNAKGTGSNSVSHLIAEYRHVVTSIKAHPLDYAVAHKGTVNLDYRFARNDGGSLLEQLGINLLFRFNSGHPFTRDSIPSPG